MKPPADIPPTDWPRLERLGLLSSNFKLDKSKAFLNVGLALSPHREAGVGNVCPFATKGCIAACVANHSGMTVIPQSLRARIARTRAFFEDRERFVMLLMANIEGATLRAKRKGLPLAIRLNVGSDIAWEKVAPQLFTEFPQVIFYDYTKNTARVSQFLLGKAYGSTKVPPNYSLTYSYNENSASDTVRDILRAGGNVAVIMDTVYRPQRGRIDPLPLHWGAYPVVDGDRSDVRTPTTDGRGVIVGLRFKGGNRAKAKAIAAGFCQQV